MVLGAAYLGRMMRTWSVCDSSGGFIHSHLKKQYLTVGTLSRAALIFMLASDLALKYNSRRDEGEGLQRH